MIEKQSRQIGEFTYEVSQLGAKLGNRVLLKLAKGLGPLFLLAAAGGARSFDGASAASAMKDLSEEDFDWIIDQLAKHTDVNLGDKSPRLAQVFDVHFAGRYHEQFQWIEFALEVNFAPFFAALRAKAEAVAKARVPTPSNSTSPSMSTGASNVS